MNMHAWSSDAVTIKVDYDTCTGQSECADACPSKAYEIQKGKAVAVNIEE